MSFAKYLVAFLLPRPRFALRERWLAACSISTSAFLAVCLFAVTAHPAVCQVTETYLVQPGSLEGQDTFWGTVYVGSGCPDCPYLYFGGWGDAYYDYFRFDLDGAPTAAETVNASFEVYVTGLAPNDPQLEVEQVTGPWTEAGATNSMSPPAVSYTMMAPLHAGWNSVDITSLYVAWQNGTVPNYGIELVPHATWQTNGSFASSDNTNWSIRPRLEVIYHPGGTWRRLAFPLRGAVPHQQVLDYGPYTAAINSVFDHSMADSLHGLPPTGFRILGCDGQVIAFTGDVGGFDASEVIINICSVGNSGYSKDSAHSPFNLTGCYPDARYLNYDGHPGVDYKAMEGTEVFAPTDAILFYPRNIVGVRDAYQHFGLLALMPLDRPDLRLYFLHLSARPIVAGADVAHGTPVSRGQQIAWSGHEGVPASAAHLHFEVQQRVPLSNLPAGLVVQLRSLEDSAGTGDPVPMASVPVDPYGWNRAAGPDPYITLLGGPASGVLNIRLWE